MKVTFGFVNFRSPLIERLERDILPTIAHYPHGEFEIICVDNDPLPGRELRDFLEGLKIPVQYLWNGGANMKVAAAKNQIYAKASQPIVIYACANHGRMFDPTWLEDMIRPFEDPQVAMTGTRGRFRLADLGEGRGTGLFVQGGLIAVRTEALRKHPMSDQYPHAHSDKWISRELLRHGYKILNIESVLSVWQEPMPEGHDYKYVHAEG